MKAAFRVLVLTVAAAMTAACQKSESPSASAGTAAPPGASAASSDAHPPFGILDVPRENVPVESGSWGYGWALDDSGIASVTASFDGGAPAAAKIGESFPGVKEAYPNMPNNDKAGFIFAIPKLAPGPHSVTVALVAKDGGQTILRRQFQAK